jgi:AcrR family transcriptional regulator
MPKLARRLGVGTMSLYRHVADKDDLVNSVAERVLDAVAVPNGRPDDWEGRVVGYLTALRQAALAHPSLSRILAERGLTVGPVFDQLEQAHAILRAAGFSELGAVRAFYTLFTYVFGFVIWELPRVHQQPPSAYAAAWNESLGRLDVASYPTLRDLRPHLITAASSEQFDYGLRRLVDSLQPPG